MTAEPLKFPCFGPLNHNGSNGRFPNAVMDWAGTPATVRERTMVAIIDSITDKPEWEHKVFQEDIVQKWRQEAIESDMDVSPKMLDWIFAELQDKARAYERDGIISTLDLDATIVKSDTAISSHLNQELRTACHRLEEVPSNMKDWHPRSEEKVVDLVHPSLFPLVYGRSKVLATGRMGLTNCTDQIGKGTITIVPDDLQNIAESPYTWYPNSWSKVFQWLPCQVEITGGQAVKITSYINNLHPVEHSSLYTVIEAYIAKSIPLWDLTLSSLQAPRKLRIDMKETSYDFPEGQKPPEDSSNDASESAYDRMVREDDWRRSTRVVIQPEPGKYDSVERSASVDLRKQFSENGLQVIVKLANIELTPEKPSYDGGSWHIEGQLNERICANALYYYDSENITESFLAFRQRVDDDDFEMKAYDQDDYEGVEEIYGVKQDEAKVQEIGRVSTRQGRLLAFPNVLQHRVSPFRLQDPSKPGHRKILALFLVDPHTPIISTANVPPQQREWLRKKLADDGSLSMLPQELADQIVDAVDEGVMGLEEAKEIRLRLMDERKAFVDDVESNLHEVSFSFCEH